ncbi:hypothetical protein Tco_0835074 [Tanacetum coccineum]
MRISNKSFIRSHASVRVSWSCWENDWISPRSRSNKAGGKNRLIMAVQSLSQDSMVPLLNSSNQVFASPVSDKGNIISQTALFLVSAYMNISHTPRNSWDKPPKDKEQASSSKGNGIDQYVPLFLHNNDTSRGDFATLSRDESYRSTQSYNVSKIGNGNPAFMARTNSKNKNWSNSNNNQFKRLNRPNLLCTHCNMNGHTADRYFELVGYPLNFKKSNGSNQGSSSNAVIPGAKDQPYVSSNTFTDEHYKRLMALISDKYRYGSIPTNVADVSKLNMTVGHPNGTKAVVTHIGSLKLTDKITINDVLVVLDYQDSVLRTQVGTGSESNGYNKRDLVVGLAAGTAAGTAGMAGDNHPHRSVSGIGCGTAGEGTSGMLSGSFGFVTRETGALIVLTPKKGVGRGGIGEVEVSRKVKGCNFERRGV